jgi:hypothetical protein
LPQPVHYVIFRLFLSCLAKNIRGRQNSLLIRGLN